MTEGWVSSKTDTAPLLVTDNEGQNNTLTQLAARYATRLQRILRKNEAKKRLVTFDTIKHYVEAETNVLALLKGN